MRLDVEHDLLHGAGERERLPILVGQIHHATVVPADVHPRVRREPDRDGVVHPPLPDRSVIDEQRHLAPGRRLRVYWEDIARSG